MAAIGIIGGKVRVYRQEFNVVTRHRVGVGYFTRLDPEHFPGGVSEGDAVCFDALTGRVVGAYAGSGDHGNDARYPGIALSTAGEGDVVEVLEAGWVFGPDLSQLNFNDLVYLNGRPGGLDSDPGPRRMVVGRVVPRLEPGSDEPVKALLIPAGCPLSI